VSTDAAKTVRHPISRWYLMPAVERVAAALARSSVRPGHLTACGLISATAAAGVILLYPQSMPLAAVLALAAWFFDRADGRLARLQNTESAWGAWLDANVDELVDLGLHVAVAAAASRQIGSDWPWLLLVGFLFGKYLLMHGLATERESTHANPDVSCGCAHQIADPSGPPSFVRRLYHLPGNTDVRVHLLIVAMLTGWLVVELAFVAAYYNLRWFVRYVLVARRLRGAA